MLGPLDWTQLTTPIYSRGRGVVLGSVFVGYVPLASLGMWPSQWEHWESTASANAEAMGLNPVEARKIFFSGYFRNCLNCDSLRWSHTHFICIPAVHIISFSVSFLSQVDELNKLASLQCMGLHSSAGRALQALTQRPRVRIPLKPGKSFFGLFSQLLKLRFTAMVTYSFYLYSRSSHHFIQCFIPFTGWWTQ